MWTEKHPAGEVGDILGVIIIHIALHVGIDPVIAVQNGVNLVGIVERGRYDHVLLDGCRHKQDIQSHDSHQRTPQDKPVACFPYNGKTVIYQGWESDFQQGAEDIEAGKIDRYLSDRIFQFSA